MPWALKSAGVNAGVPVPAVSMVHDGDRWVCLGDSITALNCYPPLLSRVFNHYHPDKTLTVINSGQGGDTASASPEKLVSRVLKYDPTIVSVMYGMNEAINKWGGAWTRERVQTDYREALTYITRTLREQGITVLLMSPTLTDPSNHSYFTLDRTPGFLRECADIVKSVAEAEGAHYIPTQEMSSNYQDNAPRGIALTTDGVHPSALGHYLIARSLWEACGFDRPLGSGGERSVYATASATPAVSASLASPFVQTNATGVGLTFQAETSATLELTWSLAKRTTDKAVYADTTAKGTATVDLVAGANSWTLPLANNVLPQEPGQSANLLLTVRSGDASQLYLLDLSRTQVLHFKDDKVSGVVETDYERPAGNPLANWEVTRSGDSLTLSFEVFDRDIASGGTWPFNRDGLNLMLDFRPTDRFADIGVDREVTQTFINVLEEPFFGIGLRAWTGRGLDFASYVGGGKTDTGYVAKLLLKDNFDLKNTVNLSKRDYVGLLVAVSEELTTDGKTVRKTTASQNNDTAVSLYANNLMILDLRNKITGDQIINGHLTSARLE